jgi:dsRNA-specific ribonuclease
MADPPTPRLDATDEDDLRQRAAAPGSPRCLDFDEKEEALDLENPKGRLWEACARLHVAPPQIRHAASGPRHRVEMQLEVGEWELTSGVHWGWSRKVAEQVAARALLDELDALGDDEPSLRPALKPEPESNLGDDVFDVDEEDVARLRQSSPKGQVYEWCQKQRPPVRRPRFEMRQARGGGALVRGWLDTLGLSSPWFRARRRKEAEQAAAEALLLLLPTSEDAPDADATATANPRTVLNELVQHGRLADCEMEVTSQRGTAHAPLFTAEGRATLLDGRVIRTAPCEGASKREAMTRTARALLGELESLNR